MCMQVLVADDDNVSRMVVCNYLAEWDYQAVQAVNGTEALEVMRGENPPRIAILDWMMPGHSGVEVSAYIEKHSRRLTYCLLLTGRSEKRDLTHALNNGAHQFLTKPIDPEVLRSHLNVGRRLIETDDALLRMEQIAAVGTLAGGIAHQYNNMNAGITGYLDLLLGNPDIPAAGHELLEKIDRICRRMRDITDMMLDFTHFGSHGRVSCSLNDIVDVVIDLEKEKLAEAGIKLPLRLRRIPDLKLERAGMTQAILHLLINARHAVLGVAEPEIAITSGVEGEEVFLRFRDNGCGIEPARQKQIFTPFFTLKGEHAEPGTPQAEVRGYGLGLSVCDNVVRRHGGRIEFTSAPGRGSEFTVFLPVGQ